MKKYVFAHALAMVAMVVSGCAVGPDFERPKPPDVHDYTQSLPALEGKGGQVLVTGRDIPGEWWELFQSRPLNDLIKRALSANPSLKAAQAALTAAHENTLAQQGVSYPNISAGFSASRQKTSSLISPTPSSGSLYYNLFTPQVSVSYMPDVFGLNARTLETLEAQEEQARFALIATNITLSANVVASAIQEASLREQIAETRQVVAIGNHVLELTRSQFAKGSATRLDIAAQELQLAQASATLPPLLNQLAQQRDLLAVLSGAFPGTGTDESFALSNFKLPRELPLSLPSQLVEHRPDIRQAEENLHAASAQIGIAIADRLPNLTLTGDIGSMALMADQLFTNGSGFWSLAGSVTQPVFDGGALLHKERAARAAFTGATEQYHATVLTAFQNVADTLHALEQDDDALKTAQAAQKAARDALELTRRQSQTGTVSYVAVLNAEQVYHQASIGLIQAQASRLLDTVALFQALGGGWWNQGEKADQTN